MVGPKQPTPVRDTEPGFERYARRPPKRAVSSPFLPWFHSHTLFPFNLQNAPCRDDLTSDSGPAISNLNSSLNVTEVDKSTTNHFKPSDGGPTIESRPKEDAAAEVLDDLKSGAFLQYANPVQAVN